MIHTSLPEKRHDIIRFQSLLIGIFVSACMLFASAKAQNPDTLLRHFDEAVSMEYAQDAFITSTAWTERVGPAAALAMIEKFERVDAAPHMLAISEQVWTAWETLSAKHGLAIHIGGFKPLIHFAFAEDHAVRIAYFTQEMLKLGFLAGGGFYAMYAHVAAQVEKYAAAVDVVFGKLAALIKEGKVRENLEGLPAASGFARVN